MLQAKKTHPLSHKYDLTEDGRALTTFSLRGGRIGARFTLRGTEYQVRTHRFSGAYELVDGDDKTVATTDRVSRDWSMTCSGRVVPFHQAAAAGREYTAIGEDGRPAGSIRHGRSETTADLPGMELAFQVFALVVVLLRGRRKRAAAAVRSTSLAGG